MAEKEKCESEKEEVNVAMEAEIYPTGTTAI